MHAVPQHAVRPSYVRLAHLCGWPSYVAGPAMCACVRAKRGPCGEEVWRMCRGSAECGGGVEEVQRRCRGGVEECRGSVEGVQRGGATSPCAEHHCMWCGKCIAKGNLKFFHGFLNMLALTLVSFWITMIFHITYVTI